MQHRIRHIMLFAFVLIIGSGLSARGFGDLHGVRIGYFMPQDAKGGMMLGYFIGKEVDETVSVGISSDLYFKNYIKESTVATDSIFSGNIVTIQQELDFSSYLLPVQGSISVLLPTGYSGWRPFLNGGLGVAFLLNREVNYLTDEKDFRAFFSFAWNAGAGMQYRLGQQSLARLELFYQQAALKGDRDKTEAGLPIYDEINMSGLGLRAGIYFNL